MRLLCLSTLRKPLRQFSPSIRKKIPLYFSWPSKEVSNFKASAKSHEPHWQKKLKRNGNNSGKENSRLWLTSLGWFHTVQCLSPQLTNFWNQFSQKRAQTTWLSWLCRRSTVLRWSLMKRTCSASKCAICLKSPMKLASKYLKAM